MLKNIVITVEESQITQLLSLSQRLRNQGMKVGSVLPFGVITGQIEESHIEGLRQDSAIDSVNLDREASIKSLSE